MPKKFRGENSKAVEARARKQAQRDAETERKQQELEDEYWQDDDKHVLKKQQRKEDREKKKADQLERKKETQRLAEAELDSIKATASGGGGPSNAGGQGRVTRAEIEAHQAKIMSTAVATATTGASNVVSVDELPLEENINRLTVDGLEARSVDQAIRILSKESASEPVDLHPEKRMRAAYLSFEERHLPEVKAQNPNLRLSQLKQIIRKDWNKSPENPLNQRLHAS